MQAAFSTLCVGPRREGAPGGGRTRSHSVPALLAVKPDAPAYLRVTGQKVSWAPPASWDLPATYFPLKYNLRLESASGRKENHFLLVSKPFGLIIHHIEGCSGYH